MQSPVGEFSQARPLEGNGILTEVVKGTASKHTSLEPCQWQVHMLERREAERRCFLSLSLAETSARQKALWPVGGQTHTASFRCAE